MNTTEHIHAFLSSRVVFSLSNFLLNRRSVAARYRQLRSSQWYTEERLRDIQFRRLKSVIAHAYRHVPYYRHKYRDAGLHNLEDIKSLEDVGRLPSLDRQEVMDHYRELVDQRLTASVEAAERRKRALLGAPILFAPFRSHQLVKNTSCGSTGSPVVYYEDGSLSAVSWAYEWYVKNWYGVKPGAKEIRMMRLSTEYRPEAKALRMRQLLWRQVVLPGINLSERDYEATLAVLLRFRPAVLWGFTSAITGLAEYVNGRDKDLGSYRPKLVMTWAEPVYAHEEEALHQAFNCPVTNLYSSHEVGHIACRCPQGSFHINQENVLAECLRPLGNAQGQEEGEILITTLFETPMPFIRYRIGDVARIGPSTCACGMKSQVMSSFLGRTYELFVTADGRMISPNFWLHIMRRDYVAGFVKKFQIVYLKDGGIRVLVVRKESSSMDTESKLRALIAGNFDPQDRIEWVYLPTITPEASGKCPLVKRER